MCDFNKILLILNMSNQTLGEFIIENQNAFKYSSGEPDELPTALSRDFECKYTIVFKFCKVYLNII